MQVKSRRSLLLVANCYYDHYHISPLWMSILSAALIHNLVTIVPASIATTLPPTHSTCTTCQGEGAWPTLIHGEIDSQLINTKVCMGGEQK